MTQLWNEPADFADEMLSGFARASSRWVRRVDGGVSRATQSAEPEVAVVIGGGSGHYPAFGGLVGPGLAHGAAMGDTFASPSARRVASVARESERGRGVLLSYGNYAGDVLHFGSAQDSLRAEGVDCRTVVVTDDIFSAPPEERHKRRGIAGDLAVFKVAGAAAAAGYDLDDVEQVALRANHRTRSMGVAFSGCTLPGAQAPLFAVPEGKMAIGLGIHGEPGIDEVDVPSAAGLAEIFVSKLLDAAEVPDDISRFGARVVPILNGLGSVKDEELYVVFDRVGELLDEAGLEVVDPRVGEFCTSFDMAGASLTLFWLDDELERLWLAPADAPSFHAGAVSPSILIRAGSASTRTAQAGASRPTATRESRSAASCVVAVLEAVRDLIEDNAERLGRIDAVAGDGDHGIGMSRGARAAATAARERADSGAGAGSALIAAGNAWSDRAGGTSGALWGVILATLGEAIGDEARPSSASVTQGVTAAAEAVMAFGKASVGDKTLVDVLIPFANRLAIQTSQGARLPSAWSTAASEAQADADATAQMLPALGRARSHGEKALGTPDPGAISLALIVERVGAALATSKRTD